MTEKFHCILTIMDPKTGQQAIVVCRTKVDEKDVLRHAENQGHKITQVMSCESGWPITLNDYEL